jgi:hypothetical protein
MFSKDEVARSGGGKAPGRQTVMGERSTHQVPTPPRVRALPQEPMFVHLFFGAVYALLHVGSNTLLRLFASRKPRL